MNDRHHPCGEPAALWAMEISRRARARARRTQAMKERTLLLVLLFVALLMMSAASRKYVIRALVCSATSSR